MAQIVPFSAILCHFRTFCKENLYLTRQPLLFQSLRQAVATDIPACRFAKHTGAGERGLPSAPLSRHLKFSATIGSDLTKQTKQLLGFRGRGFLFAVEGNFRVGGDNRRLGPEFAVVAKFDLVPQAVVRAAPASKVL